MAVTLTNDNIISSTDLSIRPGSTTYPLLWYSDGGRFSDRTPAFNASGTTGWRYGQQFGQGRNPEINSVIGWTWRQQGAGSYGMRSNGRYYAPVSGRYYFHFSSYVYNDNRSYNYQHWFFALNSGYGWNQGGTPHNIHCHFTPKYHEDGVIATCTMYLNQGQYCVVRPYWNVGATRMYGAHTMFCGALIGY